MIQLSVPVRAHFLICYARLAIDQRRPLCSGQSAFPDLLRSSAAFVAASRCSGQSAFPDLLRSDSGQYVADLLVRSERIS